MKTYCKEDIYSTIKKALSEYYSLISKKIDFDNKNINAILIIGKDSKFDSLAFVTFIMILDQELKKINFKKNLMFEIQNKQFKELTVKNLINFIGRMAM